MAENKVKYGLKNVHYAVITEGSGGAITYGTPVAIPGAVNLSLAAQGETTEFYADNVKYYAVAANQGYQGDLEVATIPEAFRTDVLGETLDSTKKILIEHSDVDPKPFALMFEFDGDKKAVRHVLYYCNVSRPSLTGSTTTSSKEPATDSMTITAIPLASGVVKASTTGETTSTVYDGWYSAVVTA